MSDLTAQASCTHTLDTISWDKPDQAAACNANLVHVIQSNLGKYPLGEESGEVRLPTMVFTSTSAFSPQL
jgi:hypothetical protein